MLTSSATHSPTLLSSLLSLSELTVEGSERLGARGLEQRTSRQPPPTKLIADAQRDVQGGQVAPLRRHGSGTRSNRGVARGAELLTKKKTIVAKKES
jgi:hypothetical protein